MSNKVWNVHSLKIKNDHGSIIGLGSMLLIFGIGLSGHGFCIFRHATGIPCPGCFMTRAFIHLVSGDISGASYYNVAVFTTVPLGIIAGIFYFMGQKNRAQIFIIMACIFIFMVWVWRLINFHEFPA